MATEEIRIRLTAEGNAKVEIDKVEKELTQLQKTTKSVGATFKNVFETAAGVAIGQGLTGAFNLATKGARQLFGVFAEGIQLAQVQEDSIQKLNTALAQSGQFSVKTSLSLQEFASALQQTTKFGDETILNAQALLQSLGRLDEDGLKEATKAALDMSAALGIDLNAAVTLVGKAAAGEISSFTRYGVVIEKGADKAETFSNTLKALNKNFGGAAAAQIETFSGATAQASNSFGDLQEQLGFVLTQNAGINKIIKESSKVFNELGQAIEDNRGELQQLATEGLIFLVDGIAIAVTGLEKLINAFQNTRKFALSLQATFASIAGNDDVENAITEQIFAIQQQQAKTGKSFDDVRKRIEEFQDKIKVSGAESAAAQDALNKKLLTQSNNAKTASTAVSELSAEQKAAAASGLALAKSLGVEGVSSSSEQQKAQLAEAQALREQDLLSQEEFFLRQAEIRQVAFQEEQTQIQAAADAKSLTLEQADAARLANAQKLGADLSKIERARTDFENKEAQRRAAAQKQSLSQIATLQSSGSKTLFRVGQAAAVANATIDGIASVQKTAAAFPFPFSIPFTVAAAAASAANIAKIVGAKPPGLQGGIDNVPGQFNVDGGNFQLAGGERVVPAKTNQDLTAFLAGQQNTDGLLTQLITAVRESGNVMVQVGDEEVTASVRRGLESGGTIAVEG